MRGIAFKIFLSFWAVFAVVIVSFPLLPGQGAGPPPAGTRPPPFPYATVAVAILLSGVVCFAMAAYLARPLRRVRDASYRIAAGDLRARVGSSVAGRHDEIGDLVRDFDAMAARIEALVHSRTQLLSDISHELRSPLARLNVALELARRRIGAQAPQELDRIESETERMNELIGRVLALARAEAGEVTDVRRPVDIGAVVRRVTDDADYEAQQLDKAVDLRIQESATVLGDERLIASAVDNVVRNALHYTPARSTVDVVLTRTGRDAVVTVRDRGPGVPAAELERIFDAFHRVENATDLDAGGMGLGLAIAQRAVAVHGGTITAANAADGGLLVTISLPTEPPPAAR